MTVILLLFDWKVFIYNGNMAPSLNWKLCVTWWITHCDILGLFPMCAKAVLMTHNSSTLFAVFVDVKG